MLMKCDPRAFARCPYNATCISTDQAEFAENSDCYLFNKKVLENPATNADKIRGMSDMELATFLYTATRACADHDCSSCPIGDKNCIVMLHWLKNQNWRNVMSNITAIQPIPKEEQCKNNEWVKCLNKNRCSFCGWDPAVSQKRTEKGNKFNKQVK